MTEAGQTQRSRLGLKPGVENRLVAARVNSCGYCEAPSDACLPIEVRDLNEISAGVVQHCNGRSGGFGGFFSEGSA